jgi:hypothetical protein
MFAAASAEAATLNVTYTEGSLTATWEQSSNPTPLSYGATYTIVQRWNLQGDYAALLWPAVNAVTYFSDSSGFSAGFDFVIGPRAYSGSEAAPVFSAGKETGYYNLLTERGGGTLTFSAVPEPSTWGMMLGGFAGLGFLGYRRNKLASVAA